MYPCQVQNNIFLHLQFGSHSYSLSMLNAQTNLPIVNASRVSGMATVVAVRDLVQAVAGVKSALEASQLVESAKHYSSALKASNGAVDERRVFLHAFNQFWQDYDRFDANQKRLAHTLELQSLLNQSLWKRLVSSEQLPPQAKIAIQQIHHRLVFAQAHLLTLEKSLGQLAREPNAIQLPADGDTFVFAGRRAGDWVPPQDTAVYTQDFMITHRHEMPAKLIACYLGGIRRLYDCCAEFLGRPGTELKLLKFETFPVMRAAFFADEAVLGVLEQMLEDVAKRISADPEELTLESIESLVEQVPLLDAMSELTHIGKFDRAQLERMQMRLKRGLWLYLAGSAIPTGMSEAKIPALQVISALATAELARSEYAVPNEMGHAEATDSDDGSAPLVSVAERLSPSRYLQAIEHFYGGDMSHTLSGMGGADEYYDDDYDPINASPFHDVEGYDQSVDAAKVHSQQLK